MSVKPNVKQNLLYQTAYQMLNTCLPLITSPYLARVLGAEKQGIFSYTQSIVNYFTLFAMLGVVNYGTRTIAACGDDKKLRSTTFWNIYIFQLSLSLVSLIIYMIYVITLCDSNRFIALLQGLYILGCIANVGWLFFGVEKFDVTVKRSIVVRLISFISILIFVNSPEDLWIYTIIMSGGTSLSDIILWKFVGKIVDFRDIRSIRFTQVKEHIKPNLLLFVPLMAMSVYHVMDKTMLGLLSTYEQTGFYYNADKVINIPICVINGVGTVMLPRMSALADNKRASTKLFNMSLEMIIMASSAMSFGIIAISNEFTPVFFGVGFEPCIYLIVALAPVLIIKSLSQTSRMQYLIPQHKEKIYIEAVFAGAIVNFLVNLLLISKLGAMGAVIGTLVAELVTCVWQYLKIKTMVSYGKAMINSLVYILFGIIMFVVIRLITLVGVSGIIGILLDIVIGGLTFVVLCISYWHLTKHPFKFILFKHRKN